jgi:hypothetical protein
MVFPYFTANRTIPPFSKFRSSGYPERTPLHPEDCAILQALGMNGPGGKILAGKEVIRNSEVDLHEGRAVSKEIENMGLLPALI